MRPATRAQMAELELSPWSRRSGGRVVASGCHSRYRKVSPSFSKRPSRTCRASLTNGSDGGEIDCEMRIERFTENSQKALQQAAALAAEYGQQAVEPEHFLLALLDQEGGLASPLLRAAGAEPSAVRAGLVAAVERLPKVSGGAEPYLSPALRGMLTGAEDEAGKLKDDYVSTEHLLLAMAAMPALAGAGVTRDGLL